MPYYQVSRKRSSHRSNHVSSQLLCYSCCADCVAKSIMQHGSSESFITQSVRWPAPTKTLRKRRENVEKIVASSNEDANQDVHMKSDKHREEEWDIVLGL